MKLQRHTNRTSTALCSLTMLTLGLLLSWMPRTGLAVEVGGPVTTDTTWTIDDSPYIVTSDINIGTPENDGTTVTLTIEPGVEVRFRPGTGLYVGANEWWPDQYAGALRAIGTQDTTIVFTSDKADPTPGDWAAIHFEDDADNDLSVLEYVEVRYGGAAIPYYPDDENAYYWASVSAWNASPTIRNSHILLGRKCGIYLWESSSSVTGNTIEQNGGIGVFVEWASSVIVENTIRDNGFAGIYLWQAASSRVGPDNRIARHDYGVYVEETRSTRIEDNTIEQHISEGIYVDATSGVQLFENTLADNGTTEGKAAISIGVGSIDQLRGNAGSGNGIDVIEVRGGSSTSNSTWSNNDLPYLISSDISVGVSTDNGTVATLTVEPGVEVRFQPGTGVYIGHNDLWPDQYAGALVAQGTETEQILFTSNAADPTSGDWTGISFGSHTDSALSALEYATVEYAGLSSGASRGAISCFSASPDMTRSIIRESSGYGILLGNSSSQIMHNSFVNIAENPIFCENCSAVTIAHNEMINIDGNAWTGIEIEDSSDVQMIENTITNVGWAGIAVYESSNVSITGNEISGTRYGIDVDEAFQLNIAGNTLTDNEDSGIYVEYASEATITGNIVTGSGYSGIYIGWMEVYFMTLPGEPGETVVANNTVSGNNYAGIEWDNCFDAPGRIEGNTITDNIGNGIISWCVPPSITNNTISGNTGYPLSIASIHFERIGTNTIEGNGQQAIEVWGGRIETDTTWTHDMWNNALLPYVITGTIGVYSYDSTTVPPTLTIEPGVELRFAENGGMKVGQYYPWSEKYYYGTLNVQGTQEMPVVLTSAAENPQPGDWQGLDFYSTPEGQTNVLEHCIIEYAEGNIDINTTANVEIKNSVITYSSTHGIAVNTGSSATIVGNTVSDNTESAIKLADCGGGILSGNVGMNNGLNGVEMQGGEVSSACTLASQQLPYFVTDHLYVRAPDASSPSAVLTIEPGTKLQFGPGASLYIGESGRPGVFHAEGTTDNPILFTSSKSPQEKGDWQGLDFSSTPEGQANVLEHCIIEYAEGNIDVNTTANVTITNSVITNSSAHGIAVHSGGSATIRRNTFSHNDGSAITLADCGGGTLSDNVGVNNGINAVEMSGGEVSTVCTLSSQPLPYLITDHLHVCAPDAASPPAILTIEPGATVQFGSGVGMYVGESGRPGALRAEGTPDNPILFTSSQENPVPGSWRGIELQDATDDAQTTFKNATIEYATTGVNIVNASPYIEAAIFEQNTTGIVVGGNNAAPTIVESTFHNNIEFGISKNKACAYNDAGCPPAEIARNTFIDHGIAAMRMSAQNGDNVYDNAGEGSGSWIELAQYRWGNYYGKSVYIQDDSIWKRNTPSLPYVVGESVSVYGSESFPAMLVIEPGVTVRFEENGVFYVGSVDGDEYDTWYEYGRIEALGTEALPITLTSHAEDPQPGDWQGIQFEAERADNPSILEHCIIEYAGERPGNNTSWTGAIRISQTGVPTIKNNLIRYTNGHGIYGSGINYNFLTNDSPIRLSGNHFTHNQESAVFVDPNWVKYIGDNTGLENGEDAIKIRSGSIYSHGIWSALANESLPFVISGDVTVRSRYSSDPIPTLVLEPGAQVRFYPGTGLYIGDSAYPGALSARGVPGTPVILTSHAVSPQPGDWKGLYYRNIADDASSFLEYTVIEYGETNVYLENAAPTIQYNTIRAASAAGIRVQNDGSNGVVLQCNNLNENQYGIHVSHEAQPTIINNNFRDNSGYGVYNTNTASITAEFNWWDDAAGPNENGERVSDNVNYQPWLTAESDCIQPPPTNSPPFAPSSPMPAHESINVDITGESVTLQWVGGDPNPWDIIEYDVWLGDSVDSLSLIASGLTGTMYQANTLQGGLRYFWKVIAHDNQGETTEGPIWQFITHGPPPDLIVSAITWEPATDIQNRDSVLFTATIENIGAGPVVDRFLVEYRRNNSYYGTQWVDQIFFPGESVAIQWSWTAQIGIYTFSVVADTDGWQNIIESDETNNGLSVELPLIEDVLPPQLQSTNPGNGANLKQVSQIEFVLFDQHSSIDDVVVKANVSVVNDQLGMIAGAVTENDDRFTFHPTESPILPDGVYQVSVLAQDTQGNSETYNFSFTVDGKPVDLEISELIWEPSSSVLDAGQSVTFDTTIHNAGTGAVLNAFRVDFLIDEQVVRSRWVQPPLGAGATVTARYTWIAQPDAQIIKVNADATTALDELNEANNVFSLTLPTVEDTSPPVLVNTVPVNNALLQQVTQVTFRLDDQYGGVDDEAVKSTITVTDSNSGTSIQGSIIELNDTFTFTPDVGAFPDGAYQVAFTACDLAGNTQAYNFTFTVDGTPPAAPTITGGTVTPTGLIEAGKDNRSNTATVTLTGTRDVDTSVRVNGQSRVNTGSEGWATTLTLPQGDNMLEITLLDRAGNSSPAVVLHVFVDSEAPTVRSIEPADNMAVNVGPDSIMVTILDAHSGIDLAHSLYVLKDETMADVTGEWQLSADETQLTFTPSAGSLSESTYTLVLQIADKMGNASSILQTHFTVDTTPPPAPVVDPVVLPVHSLTHTITGTKEAYAAILVNDETVVEHTAASTWQYTATLAEGANCFIFIAQNRSGDTSAETAIEIVYENLPPEPVTTLTIDAEDVGSTARLDWSGYDEVAQGQLAGYRIYAETTEILTVADLQNLVKTVSAGTFRYTVDNLVKGTPYWIAVVPMDETEQTPADVFPVIVTPVDVIPPEGIMNIHAECFEDRLIFRWAASLNSYGDLAGYKLYFNGEPVGNEIISVTDTQYERTGLMPATAYSLMVAAVDADDNESRGRAFTGVTLLENPAVLTTDPQSGYVDMTWTAIQPARYRDHYAVYISGTEFTTVAGLTPALTTTDTHARISGLTNETTYYLAVTTVNTSGGEQKAVTAVSAMPVPDTKGPTMSQLQANSLPLTDGITLTKPSALMVNLADPSGVDRLECYIESPSFAETMIGADTQGSPTYTCPWDIATVTDDQYTLSLVAYDTLGNSVTESRIIHTELGPPTAPAITQPASGTLTNQPEIQMSGTAVSSSDVLVYLNETLLEQPLPVQDGQFTGTLTLAEGTNRMQAVARYRGDAALTGPRSNVVTVMVDTQHPSAPTHVDARSGEGGPIKLNWRAPEGFSVKEFRLYRAPVSFADATLDDLLSGQIAVDGLETLVATTTSYEDFPPTDGIYYYRLAAITYAGNVSDLSEEVSAQSDRIPPKAERITCTPEGQYDPATGRVAPGAVTVTLAVSEPLRTVPFLSLVPHLGVQMSIALKKTDELEYAGQFEITDTTPSGTAYMLFSGRDIAGNKGTTIVEGETLELDTEGPAVTRLSWNPEPPMRNDAANPLTVTLTLGLDEVLGPQDNPTLSYQLSGPQREPISITDLTPVSPATGEAEAWQAVFTLPSDAGIGSSGTLSRETLTIIYQGRDELGNTGNNILTEHVVMVYQGELPALETPTGLTAETLSGGRIKLTWNAVTDASGYHLYRQAPGESDLSLYHELLQPASTDFIDQTQNDGIYRYAIASLRQANTQTAVSAVSDAVEADADGTVPVAPQSLTVTLTPQGMAIDWTDTLNIEAVTYNLYRAHGMQISEADLSTLTPLIAEIPAQYMSIGIVDPHPSTTEPCYAMTAADTVGNESLPSPSAYHNVGLLPVSQIVVRQQDMQLPEISWEHPSADSLAGYILTAGPTGQETALHQGVLDATSYTDAGYNGRERRYVIMAVDTNGAESLSRSITLPDIRMTRHASRLKRGIMNHVEYTVENLSSARIDGMQIHTQVEAYAHTSASFGLEPGESQVVAVTVGGYADLPVVADILTTLAITPNSGELIEITRTSQIDVTDGMVILGILNEEFTRGISGEVRFTLKNTGDDDIEVLTAVNGKHSPDVRYTLYDTDGNVLASAPFLQTVGQHTVMLANGNTVARVPSGGIFTSAPTTLAVPSRAPNTVVVKLTIDHLYYYQDRPDQVTMDGAGTTHRVSLQDTSYYGEVLDITPQTLVAGDQNDTEQQVTITGRAVEQTTGQPLPEVPLTLVISVSGFERSYQVYTDSQGTFTYTFTPLAVESGFYTVRAVHPDLRDRPVHGSFVIQRVSLSPDTVNLSLTRNYQNTVTFRVNTGEGTLLHNVGLEYRPEDQPGGAFPQGIFVDLPQAVDIGSNSSRHLAIKLWGDATAAQTGHLVFRITSAERPTEGWGTVAINTAFYESAAPRPNLKVSPGYAEVGALYGETATAGFTLSNTGDAPLHDVALTLLADPAGTPAPDWVFLNTIADQGTLPAGERRDVRIAFQPNESVTEGEHTFFLQVTNTENQHVLRNLYVNVTRSDTGHVLFKISDIYTGTKDENQTLIQGLADAKIRLRNEDLPTLAIPEQRSDQSGEFLFEELPSGRYTCRITASDHEDYTGHFWIQPGLTATQDVFLNYELVTVEWDVTEITIEDEYDITLKATYKTDVPAPVVVAEPAFITLPKMQLGDVYQGEITLTNHGLIRADHLNIALPENDQYYTYEILPGVPTSLSAKERITIPYRVTRIQAVPGADDGSGGGDACGRTQKCLRVTFDFECANGNVVPVTLEVCLYLWLSDCGETQAGAGEWPWDPPDGGGTYNQGGSNDDDEWQDLLSQAQKTSIASWKELEGLKCYPDAEGDECWGECICYRPPTCQNIKTDTGSYVNNLTHDYQTRGPQLSVRVPNGRLIVTTLYKQGMWMLAPSRGGMDGLPRETTNLQFHHYGDDSRGYVISGILKDGNISYQLPPENFALTKERNAEGVVTEEKYDYTGPQIYRHGRGYTIRPVVSGWRWSDRKGNWKEYNETGRFAASGTRRGATYRTFYDAEGKLLGYADSSGTQVIWVEYGADNLIAAVHDANGWRLEYEYHSDGRLWKARDVALNEETIYTYDDDGRLRKVVNPDGRESNIGYDASGDVASVLDETGSGYTFTYDYDERKKEYYTMSIAPDDTVKEVWYDEDGSTKRMDINGTTTQRIERDGNALIVTNAHGERTRQEYDEWGNLTRILYPDGSERTFEYEHTFHQCTKLVEQDGRVTRYEYDDRGQMTRKIYKAGTAEEEIRAFTYTTDGLIKTSTLVGDGTTPDKTTTYTYNDLSKVMTTVRPNGDVLEKTYYRGGPLHGKLHTVTINNEKIMIYNYHDDGSTASIVGPNPITTP